MMPTYRMEDGAEPPEPWGVKHAFVQGSARPRAPEPVIHPAGGPIVFLNAGVAFDHLQRVGVTPSGHAVRISALPEGNRHGTLDQVSRICREAGAAVVITNHWGFVDAEEPLKRDGLKAYVHPEPLPGTINDELADRIAAWCAARGNPRHVVIERVKPVGSPEPWICKPGGQPLTAPEADSIIEALSARR